MHLLTSLYRLLFLLTLLGISMLGTCSIAFANSINKNSTENSFHVTQERLHEKPELGKRPLIILSTSANIWRVNDKDSAHFSLTYFSDTTWQSLRLPIMTLTEKEYEKDTVIRWFRTTLTIDSSLRNSVASIVIHKMHGEVEMYVNGERLYVLHQEASPDLSGMPLTFHFTDDTSYVLAIRYTIYDAKKCAALHKRWLNEPQNFRPLPSMLSVTVELGVNNVLVHSTTKTFSTMTGFSSAIAAFLSAIFVIHILLFLFEPNVSGNLWYSLFSLFLGFLIAVNIFDIHFNDVYLLFYLHYAKMFVLYMVMPIYLGFLYHIFYPSLPSYWKYFALGSLLLSVAVVESSRHEFLESTQQFFFAVEFILIYACFIEAVRVTVLGIKRKIPGSWIIAPGVFAFIFVNAYMLTKSLVTDDPFLITGNQLWAFFGNQFAMSVYLAHEFARTRRRLSEKLREVQELSIKAIHQERVAAQLQLQAQLAETRTEFLTAENDRKNRELEEARQLQRAILPKHVPPFVTHDIAVFTQPAAEVGGDYYDYFVRKEDGLLFIIGDATGHGLKAGMMVSITKGLLSLLEEKDSLTEMLSEVSRAIRTMKLGNLFMAMSMADISDNGLTVAGAGIPPVLIFRAQTGVIEEVLIKGMPLGALKKFPYQQTNVPLHSQDVLLFCTDGILESRNAEGEQYGAERLRSSFQTACKRCTLSEDILSAIRHDWQEWAGETEPEDDITVAIMIISPVQQSYSTSTFPLLKEAL